jgi:hypothetical protein
MRVMVCSSATMGSTERAKVSCTGPRTWPQFTRGHDRAKGAHVKEVLAHPFARLAHLIGAAFALFFGGFLLFASVATFSVAASACSSGATARFNAE